MQHIHLILNVRERCFNLLIDLPSRAFHQLNEDKSAHKKIIEPFYNVLNILSANFVRTKNKVVTHRITPPVNILFIPFLFLLFLLRDTKNFYRTLAQETAHVEREQINGENPFSYLFLPHFPWDIRYIPCIFLSLFPFFHLAILFIILFLHFFRCLFVSCFRRTYKCTARNRKIARSLCVHRHNDHSQKMTT